MCGEDKCYVSCLCCSILKMNPMPRDFFLNAHCSPFIASNFDTFKLQQESLKNSSKTTSKKEEEQRNKGQEAEHAAVTGSFSAELGYSNPYIYDQFELQTTEQRINQIILLQVG